MKEKAAENRGREGISFGDDKNTTPAQIIQFPEAGGVLKGSLPPLVPAGEYSLAYIGHDAKRVFRTPKVFVRFRIVDPGEYHGVLLYRAYRVAEILGKGGRNASIQLKHRSELFLTLCRLFDTQRDFRPDRVSLKHLKSVIVRGTVRTVTTDYEQRPLPEYLRYSVVDQLQFLEVGP